MPHLGVRPQDGHQLLIYEPPSFSYNLLGCHVIEPDRMKVEVGAGPHDPTDLDTGQIVKILNTDIGDPSQQLVTYKTNIGNLYQQLSYLAPEKNPII